MTDLHLVFRQFPEPHEPGAFVEAETPSGRSVACGEWNDRPDGFTELVIPNGIDPWKDINLAPKDGTSILVCGGFVKCDSTWYDQGDTLQTEADKVYWRDGNWCAGTDQAHDEFVWILKPRFFCELPKPPQ